MSLSQPFRTRYGLDHLAKIEYSLQEGCAHDALDNVRKSIKIFNHNLDFKKTNVHGQRPNTRAQAFLRTLTEDKISGAEKYRSERKALLALGLPETDQTLQDLQDDQLWSKDISRPACLSNSHKEDPWFWHVGRPSGLTEAEDREWDIERKQYHMLNSDVALISPIHLVDRVKWFHDRSARDRAREEKEILEEELRR